MRPMKRRGNRRYYQHHEVLMIRKIRDLLYDQGFTIGGARNKLHDLVQPDAEKKRNGEVMYEDIDVTFDDAQHSEFVEGSSFGDSDFIGELAVALTDSEVNLQALQRLQQVRLELFEIRDLLSIEY